MIRFVKPIVLTALPALAFALGCGTASAQATDSAEVTEAAADSPDNEIIVEAPRRVPVPGEGQRDSFTGAPVAVTTVQMQLLYGDLDLGTSQGAQSMMVRLERVAQDACKALDRLYPLNPDPDCVAKTLTKATPLAKAAIAAAQPR